MFDVPDLKLEKLNMPLALRISLICVAVGWPSVAFSQQVTHFTPKHIANLRLVASAVLSPDGQQTAYLLSVPRRPLADTDGGAWTELHVIDASGQSHPFVTGQVSVSNLVWSHDGKYLFYTARRHDDSQTCVYRIPIAGGESQRVVQHDTSIVGFDLHPDGRQIAFLAVPKLSDEQKKLGDQGFDQEIFEEDGLETRVWITELDLALHDSSLNAPSPPTPNQLELPGSASQVVWNHAGTSLAVVLAPTPTVDDSYMAKRMHIVDASTGKIIHSLQHEGKLGTLAWSPDDKHLAFIGSADVNDPHEGRLLVSATTKDAGHTDLLPQLLGHVTSFAWKNDNSLIWSADENTYTRVGEVLLDGTSRTLVAPSPTNLLSDIHLNIDGSKASCVGHSRSHPTEVYRIDLGSATVSRLTNSNPWLDDMRFAKQETIVWAANDGLELQGVLIYPLDYQAGQKYPLIMLVHGGPESHEPDGWLTSYSRPGQVAAARGFFVFYPNYRGSTGRGVEFSKLGQADAAGKEFSDLIDGIDYLISGGYVEGSKVGITGGSYGGYASAWGATYYSDRFAASVMFVGISDNVSKVGTTDIPNEMYLVHHRKRLWEDWNYFVNSSPIHYVERNRTPTLILHGKEDPRVHPSQSLELHRHLKTLGKAPVRLVLYAGEGHGNRKAAARLDYHMRMLQWMEHYLKGPGGEPPPYELDYAAEMSSGSAQPDDSNP